MEVILILLAGFGLASVIFTGVITWFCWTVYRAASWHAPALAAAKAPGACGSDTELRDPLAPGQLSAADGHPPAIPYSLTSSQDAAISRHRGPGGPQTPSLARSP